ncbi:MAG: hypothetical protein AAGK21_15725 [Bacteroidota bacterium]
MPVADAVVAFAAIISLFVALPWITFRGIQALRSPAGGTSMRKSDLDALIEESVRDATASLQRRVEILEAIVTEEQESMDRIDPAVLADALDPVADDEGPAAARRRARS